MYIYHHLGLGDHIICNGLVRELSKKLEVDMYIPCKKHNFESVEYMYRDSDRITVVAVANDREANALCKNKEHIKIGFSHAVLIENNKIGRSFDETFYNIANIPFEKRWDSFHMKRDRPAEKKLYKKLNPENKKYVFVHDDPSRDINIDYDFDGKFVIRPDKSYSNVIFHYAKIIENADEIHCIDSSFKSFADSLDLSSKKTDKSISTPSGEIIEIEKTNLYFHIYPRQEYLKFGHTASRNNWMEIK